MRHKLYWGFAALIILIIGIGTVSVIRHEKAIHKQLKAELDEANKLLEEQNKPSEVPDEKGHVHEDGTFHVGEHNPFDTPTWTPTQVQIPEGITDPDVKAAWERLDYISKNIWAFGGVASPRAEELIAELYPPTISDDSHGEGEMDMLSELAQYKDPRAAIVFATYAGEGSIGGWGIVRALVEIGVPAVPYLIPYIDPPYDVYVKNPAEAAIALGRIGAQHREELGGVVEHIIIPKLEAFLTAPVKGPSMVAKSYAAESLEMLKK